MSEIDIAKLTAPFPPNAIKQRQGGHGKMLDYLETHTVIHRLNDATGNQWGFSVRQFEKWEDLLVAIVELTIPGLGTRTGTGVQKMSERGGEDLVKGAVSDGLKKAATLFGVGLELYGPDYANVAPATPAPKPAAATSAPPVDERGRYQQSIKNGWHWLSEHIDSKWSTPHKQYADMRQTFPELPESSTPTRGIKEWFETATVEQMKSYLNLLGEMKKAAKGGE